MQTPQNEFMLFMMSNMVVSIFMCVALRIFMLSAGFLEVTFLKVCVGVFAWIFLQLLWVIVRAKCQ